VYQGLAARNISNKEWIHISTIKEYLNLPELIGERIVK